MSDIHATAIVDSRARLGDNVKIGPYCIIEAIGRGGMGEVYRARDTRLERDVAVKILPAHLAADEDGLGSRGHVP